MLHTIERITGENYHKFDDMIHWRIHNQERSLEEKTYNQVNQVVPEELNRQGFYVFSASVDNKYVGWISLIYLPKVGRKDFNGFLYVDELWVQEDYRNNGLARALMEKADHIAQALKPVGIRLGVNVNNPGAKYLYESCGYATTGQAFTMEKR